MAERSLYEFARTARLPQQRHDERCCGQLCVAAIAGINRAEVFRAFGGHNRGTNARHVKEALARLGFKTGERCVRIGKKMALPRSCLVRVKQRRADKKYRSHWILIVDNFIYDPCGHLGGFLTLLNGDWVPTSYLPFWKP